jgi:choice-of-anchor B domain-containing protein
MKFLLILLCSLPILNFAQVNMSQLGHLDLVSAHGNSDANDIWGYVDGNGNEYAIVGLNDGTSVVDVTDPANPTEVFYEPGMNSVWRDIKTWNNHAYVTTEAQNGLLIIDLSTLPGNANLATNYYNGPSGNEWESAHNLYIDENGFCYIFGANRGEGGTIILDLNTDPMNPVEVGEEDTYYTHDGVVRGDTLYQAHILDGFFTLTDISDKANPVFLGQQNSPGNFAHNLWFNDDANYIYTTDEITNGFIGEYDISDPNNIVETDRIQSSPGMDVIPHNVHFLNDYIITSYYRDGVTVHDVSNKGNMIEVGNYDTSPTFSGDGFNGCWGVYPWLPSGNIIASDIENGLHVLGVTYTRGCYLEGVVTNSVTSNPINGVAITIVGNNIINATDVIGEYATGLAAAGTYDIIFSHPSYYDDTVFGITLTNGALTNQNMQLVPIDPIDVTVSISESILTVQIPNANVEMVNDDFTHTGITGNSGTITFTGVIPGDYLLTIGKWGYKTQCISVSVDNSSSTINVNLMTGYYDDFTFDFDWVVSGSAPDGIWERAEPFGTTAGPIFINPDEDFNGDCGDQAYVTGNSNTPGVGDDDVDIADAILTSPSMDLSSYNSPIVNAKIWWQNVGGGSTPNDTLKIYIISNGTRVLSKMYTANQSDNSWQDLELRISDFVAPSADVSISLHTADWQAAGGHLVEAGLDVFEITDGMDAGIAGSFEQEGIINIFPNPSNGQFTVLLSTEEEIFSVQIYDAFGRIVKQYFGNDKTYQINEKLNSGIYFVQTTLENKTLTKKLIIK